MKLLLFVCLGVAASFALACADCPTSVIAEGCWDWLGSETDLPGARWDGLTGTAPWQANEPCPVSCYDLRAGLLMARGNGGLQLCGSASKVRDAYRIIGLPQETAPVSFVAELWIEGTIEGEGLISAAISKDDIFQQDLVHWKAGPVSTKIQRPLSQAPEETFTLASLLQAQGTGLYGGDIVASATIHFSGLPDGARVVSCQNYDLPVPVRSSTWGSVRALYR